MKRVLLGIAAVLGILILGVLGLAMTKPAVTTFDRTITLAATPADVAPFAENLESVQSWSPWNAKDPNLTQTWSDSKTGVGAWYGWTGDEETVGSGRQTISAVEPGRVAHDLEFFTPFEGKARSDIAWVADGDGTTVTWGYAADNNLMSKVMLVFMSIEDMIGPDYEAGLQMLKPLVEAAATERVAAEEAAARAAEAAAITPSGRFDVGR